MSFILDALKKSEESRQQETIAGTKKRVLALGPSGQSRWPLWLLMLLLPAALAAGWWAGQTPHSPTPVATEQVERAGAAASAANQPVRPEAVIGQTASPTAVAREVLPVVPISERDDGPTKPTVAAAPVPVQSAAVKAPTPAPAKPETVTEPSLPAYADLSRELRERLPDLAISLHFFSTEPARRMIRINNRLLRQGETVAEGLIVHEITPSTTVFDFHGMLFEIKGPGG